MQTSLLLAAVAFVLVACSDSGESAPPGSSSSSASSSSTSSSSSSSSSGSGGSDGGIVNGVPTNAAEMNAWLHTKAYATWSKESAPHASEGPHASSVLTFINRELEGSLASGAAEHPAGSVAVKEFLGEGGVTGWAVGVKTKATSENGTAWYWYETFSNTPGKHGIEGQGEAICVNCHADGKDFVLSRFPLR